MSHLVKIRNRDIRENDALYRLAIISKCAFCRKVSKHLKQNGFCNCKKAELEKRFNYMRSKNKGNDLPIFKDYAKKTYTAKVMALFRSGKLVRRKTSYNFIERVSSNKRQKVKKSVLTAPDLNFMTGKGYMKRYKKRLENKQTKKIKPLDPDTYNGMTELEKIKLIMLGK